MYAGLRCSRMIGAAGKAVVYQWEARKRCPSPVFWCRIMDLDPALPDVAKTAGLSPPPPESLIRRGVSPPRTDGGGRE